MFVLETQLPSLTPCDLCQTISFTLYFYTRGGGGGSYLEGRFNGRFFALRNLGGLYLEGLILGGVYFWNITVFPITLHLSIYTINKFSNVKVLPKVFHVDNYMGSCSGKEKLVESKTRYQIFLRLLSSHLLFLFPRYRVLQYVL